MNEQKPPTLLCRYTMDTITACRHYAPASHGGQAGAAMCHYAVLDELSAYTHRRLCHRDGTRPSTALVVDDNAPVRDLIRIRLQSEGFAVRTACNGEIALQRMGEGRPDLLITDWHMPAMDGIELIAEMRCRHLHGIPVLLLTSEPSAELRRRVADYPNVTVLAKWARWCDVQAALAAQRSNAAHAPLVPDSFAGAPAGPGSANGPGSDSHGAGGVTRASQLRDRGHHARP